MSSWRGLLLLSTILISVAMSCGSCDCNGNGIPECGPPIVDAGGDQAAVVGETVVLRGSVRFPPEDEEVCITEKDTLLCEWEQMSGPDVELEGANQREASFVPAEEGSYKFRFRCVYPITEVNKEEEKPSQWDSVTVEVSPVICDPPVADAGPDQNLSAPAGTSRTVLLDGKASHPAHQPGCTCAIISYAWTVITQPAGSDVTITDAGQSEASVEITIPGEYVFQLEVQDDCGNTSTDTVTVTLEESTGCGADLTVTAVDAATRAGIAGASVIVIDAGGAEHTATADGGGVAVFDSLADGARQSITVVAGETVDAWGMSGDPNQRSRYEITTVADHCESRITIPLMQTRSGEKSGEWGTVVAKVPRAVFDMLPHSWRCQVNCTTNANCQATEFCQTDPSLPCGPNPPAVPDGSCTPRSLLPIFSLGVPYISGQFRVVITIPLYPIDNMSYFPVNRLFAPPPTADGLLPGNLATDDAFLNGLGEPLGLDVWGDICVSTSDCGSPDDYVCEENPDTGDYQCKDKNPLRNIKMKLPVGQSVRIIVLAGVMNVNMMDLLPVLLPMVTGGGNSDFDVGALLGAFKLQTLHICPIMANVAAGTNDITGNIASINPSNCWNIDYRQMEVIQGLEDSTLFQLDTCVNDDSCCDQDGKCGWPDSGRKCLADPNDPASDKCFMPLFREKIITSDTMHVLPATTGFDPTGAQVDGRLCTWIPDTVEFEKLCDSGTPGFYESCNPPEFCTVDVPAATECSFPYGLALVAMDVPAGNDKLPEGGRVGVGFNFNRTPISMETDPVFLVPDLAGNNLTGAVIQAAQIYLRNVTTLPDGSYEELPGRLGASAKSSSNTAQISLPEVLPLIEPVGIPDAGVDVRVTLVTDDPTVCPPVIERSYSAAVNMREPQSGQHNLPSTVGYAVSAEHELAGLTLARVDRVQPNQAEYEIVDLWWRIYAPVETTSITLPASANPFSPGTEVWLGFWGSAFEVPFDFNLFNNGMILTGQKACTKDDYALIAP